MPFAQAGIWIERHYGATEQVFALANIAVEIRARIADAPVESIGVGVIRAGHPGRGAAATPAISLPGVVAELARSGNRVEAPQAFAQDRVVGVDEAADSKLGA